MNVRQIFAVGFLLAFATCVLCAFVAYRSLQRSHHGNLVRSVIETCQTHVATTGQWPKSWADLEAVDTAVDWEFAKQICEIDFSISCADVGKMSVENFQAIYPRKVAYKPESSIESLIELCAMQRD